MFDEENEDDLSVDLTPLIDVIFMLLVFFIMTTTFSKPMLEIMLPEAVNTAEKTKDEELLISIDAKGNIYYKEEQINIDELSEVINSHPKALINFYVDKETPFEFFIKVVDRAKAREGGNFVISTQNSN